MFVAARAGAAQAQPPAGDRGAGGGLTAATDKKQHPLGEPAPGKALVYVVRPTMMGNKIQTKLAVDAQWAGVNRGHNYFFLQLDPGQHYFCSKAENKSVLAVRVEAGKTYYVEQMIKTGRRAAADRQKRTTAENRKSLILLAKLPATSSCSRFLTTTPPPTVPWCCPASMPLIPSWSGSEK